MWRLADRQLDEFLAEGHSEFLAEYAKPFSLLVIADLLGVPEEDHREFRVVLGAERPGARVGSLDHESVGRNPLEFLDEKFSGYLEDRRSRPRDDVLTDLATAKYPDGSTRRSSTWCAPRHFVRGRPGDHRQAAVGRDQGPRRAPGHSAGPARGPQPDPHLHRGVAAAGEPGEERLPAGPPDDEGRRNWTSRPAPS